MRSASVDAYDFSYRVTRYRLRKGDGRAGEVLYAGRNIVVRTLGPARIADPVGVRERRQVPRSDARLRPRARTRRARRINSRRGPPSRPGDDPDLEPAGDALRRATPGRDACGARVGLAPARRPDDHRASAPSAGWPLADVFADELQQLLRKRPSVRARSGCPEFRDVSDEGVTAS
jgi:hypothetical protein